MDASAPEGTRFIADQIGRVADALFAQAKALRDSAKTAAQMLEVSKAMLMVQIGLAENSCQLEAKLMQSLQASAAPMTPHVSRGRKPN